MSDVGKLVLKMVWDGRSVVSTEIRSTRPMAAQMLNGKTPTQVMQIVPLLFGVCGRAQGAAAVAALQVARCEKDKTAATMERAIVLESIREHLWHMMLSWPKMLGLETQEKMFAGWHPLLSKHATGEIGEFDAPVFLREFELNYLGMPVAEWRLLDNYSTMQHWWCRAQSPLARLLAKLDGMKFGDQGMAGIGLLPSWSAAEAQQACGGRWGAEFSSRPDCLGEAVETGALSYFTSDKLLNDVWHQSRFRLMIRLLARVLDVIDMASGNAPARLDATSPAEGAGIAVVRTARGLLMHHVQLAAEKVANYVIVAPTEWNFHPDGSFAKEMRGLREHDAVRLQQTARIAALSLDPCVAFEIEVSHA